MRKSKLFGRIAFFLFLLLATSSPAFCKSAWESFTPSEGDFSVLMPAGVKTKEMGDFTQYISEEDGVQYVAMAAIPWKVYKGGFPECVKSFEEGVLSKPETSKMNAVEKDMAANGWQGKEILFNLDGQNLSTALVAHVPEGNNAYVLMVASPASKDSKKFFQSLKLVPVKERPTDSSDGGPAYVLGRVIGFCLPIVLVIWVVRSGIRFARGRKADKRSKEG